MKLVYAFLVLPLFGVSCAHPVVAKPHIDPGRYAKTIKEGTVERTYVLRVPKNYDNRTNLPLVVLLHGWTSNANEAEVYTEFGAEADKEGFILAIPDGSMGVGKYQGWNTGFLNLGAPKVDDVKLVGDLLDQLEQDMYVDENRVCIAGHSNGAMMAYTVASRLSDRIAAIGVVSGAIGILSDRVADPLGPVSAIIFHGKKDPTVPYDATTNGLIQSTPAPESAKWWAQKDGCGPMVETSQSGGKVVVADYKGGKGGVEVEFVTLVDGTHDWPKQSDTCPVSAAAMIWDFFKSHPKH